MVTYDKPKRKNSPAPLSILHMLSSLVRAIVYYGLLVPVRWMWRQVRRFLAWNWQIVRLFFGGIGRRIGSIFRWTWRIMSTILQKTLFAPFIAVGRLLGFLPNAVPKGLSAKEAEVYQRINRSYRRQKRWYLHVISFLIGMVILWFSQVFAQQTFPRIDVAVMLTLIWLVLLATHRLWMNLGKSEDRDIGEALQRLRDTEQTIYYEEEIYSEQPYDPGRLQDRTEDDIERDDDHLHHVAKAKRQGH